jgi:hypothetical protein
MRIEQEKSGSSETLTLARPMQPLPIALALLSLLVALWCTVVILTRDLQVFVYPLLMTVAGSCLALALVAIDQLRAQVIGLTPEGLDIRRLVGGQVVAWPDLAAAILVPVGGILGASKDEEAGGGSIGIGIFLRQEKAEKGASPTDREPDLIVLAVPKADLEQAQKAVAAVMSYQRRALAGGGMDRRREVPKFGAPAKDFRRRPASAKSAA